MPDLKISQLPAATTPLAGTELVPIVQSGTTDKVTVADLTAGRAVSASALTASSGNLTFSGTAQRITGDFSNTTVANRLMVQTTTTNGNTLVGVMPNGTGNVSHISFYSSTDTVDGSFTRMGATSATSESYIQAGRSGTGTYYTLTFYAGGSRRVDIDTSGNLDIKAGNLSFSSTAQRITGDMSNATQSNRLAFQTSTTNGVTTVYALPNGTATFSAYRVFNNADPTNAAFLELGANGSTEARLVSSFNGTGTYLPMTFYTGGNEAMRITTNRDVGIGTTNPGAKLQINVQDGFRFDTGAGAKSFMRFGSAGTGESTAELSFTRSTGAIAISVGATGGSFTDLITIIGSTGNVGIGTVSPGALLDVGGGGLRVASTGAMTSGNLADAVGYKGTPINEQSAAYGLQLTDQGKTIVHPITDNNARTFTIPANGSIAFPVGTTITFINMINTVTIAITTDTMYLAGAGTTGSRTLAAYGMATAVKITSTSWIISGNGLT